MFCFDNIRKRLTSKTNTREKKTFKFICPEGRESKFEIDFDKYKNEYNRKEILSMLVDVGIIIKSQIP